MLGWENEPWGALPGGQVVKGKGTQQVGGRSTKPGAAARLKRARRGRDKREVAAWVARQKATPEYQAYAASKAKQHLGGAVTVKAHVRKGKTVKSYRRK